MARLGGIVNVTVDGTNYECAGQDFAWSSYTVTRETLTSLSNNAPGYKELPKACFIEFTTRDIQSVPLATWQAMTNSTVTAVLANGKTLVGTGMWLTEQPNVNSVESTFKVRFEGPVVVEGSIA